MSIEELISRVPASFRLIDDSGEFESFGITDLALKLSTELRRAGVRKGDVVAILADNGLELVATLFAVVFIGGVAALLDPGLPPVAIQRALRGARVSVLCWSGTRARNAVEAEPVCCRVLEIMQSDRGIDSKKLLSDGFLGTAGVTYFRCLPEPALIFYSSGTTGEPKGIVLTQQSILSNVKAIASYLLPSAADTFLIVKSMVHSSTLIGEVLLALSVGAKVIAMDPLVSPMQLARRIRERRPTIICLNPQILRLLMKTPVRAEDICSVHTIHVSGSIVERQLLDEFLDRFSGIRLINGYGLTEAGPRVAQALQSARKLGSVGQAIEGVELWVARADGSPCAPREPGEVMVRSPSLFSGYLVDGVVHAPALRAGALATGDLGFVDEDRDLYIIGRMDDMIITGSHKVHPLAIEELVLDVAGVTDCIVFGVDDQMLGQRIICAYTTVASDPATLLNVEREIWRVCGQGLAKFQAPKALRRWSMIPSSGGKKSRRLARERFHSEKVAGDNAA